MKRILITGISGVGKSTLAEALAAQGYKAIDADTAEWCEWVAVPRGETEYGSTVEPERDWVWREDRIEELLDAEDSGVLFVHGCAINIRRFLPRFDRIILLSTPAPLTVARLAQRTNNPYGKNPDEVARILELKTSVEPALRAIATLEIDTTMPLAEVLAQVLAHSG